MSRRKRDYRAEYARRIARGTAKGISRSQARGHPKPKEAAVIIKAPAEADRRRSAATRLQRCCARKRA